MNKSDVEKHLNNTKKIFKFIINHTNDLTNFKSIENFRNLYMTLDLMTNNTIYEVGINCKLSDIIDGEKLITDFLEDEFLRSTNDDINFITLNGIKSKREDGFLFNMDGHIMKNIKCAISYVFLYNRIIMSQNMKLGFLIRIETNRYFVLENGYNIYNNRRITNND